METTALYDELNKRMPKEIKETKKPEHGSTKGVDKDMMNKMGKMMADKEMMKKHYGKGK